MLMLKFLVKAYATGPKLLKTYGDDSVYPLLKATRHLQCEAHKLKGFVRFSEYNGILASVITPKNFILPYLAGHFVMRYFDEDFIIFDKTHKVALVWQNKKKYLVTVDHIDFPDTSQAEERYRSLWKNFYNTIAIEARTNPRCRMSHMPKRYWENMLEVQHLLK